MPDPGKKIANSLVAMSSAAILAVYSAGYTRTRTAARRLEAQSEARIPAPVDVVKPVVQAPASPVPAAPKSTHSVSPKPKPGPTPTEPAAVVERRSLRPWFPRRPIPEVAAVPAAPAPTPNPPPPPPAPSGKTAPILAGARLGTAISRRRSPSKAGASRRRPSRSASHAIPATSSPSCRPKYRSDKTPDVDYATGATQSANAFYAVVDALGKAK